MPIELKMPALSPTMEEGTLAKWLVKEGDKVVSGDILAEIETDKATMEFEAVDEGTIAKILVPEGTDGVKVGAPIAILAGEGEDASAAAAPKASRVSGWPASAPSTSGQRQGLVPTPPRATRARLILPASSSRATAAEASANANDARSRALTYDERAENGVRGTLTNVMISPASSTLSTSGWAPGRVWRSASGIWRSPCAPCV